jgi:hypothetical protein
MKILPITLIILIAGFSEIFAQQTYYDVTSGNGNGLRFWSSDSYKIHMGNTSEYKYGPVTDYSIKMNMNSTTGRGWTWGQAGLAPIAAISNVGNMQIAGSFTSLGNLGIGTTNPISRLHIYNGDNSYGAILAQANESSFHLYTKTVVTQPTNVESFRIGLKYNSDERNGYISFFRGSSTNGGFLGFSTNGIERVRISSSGNFGIGTPTPDYKLDVLGTIRANEVKVATGWSDFVFQADYDLPTLQEVETFIDQNGHLPDIPSAEEVKADGISLGEMDAKLLQKIEELTLYVIELKKSDDKKTQMLEDLKNENEELKGENQIIKSELLKEIEIIKSRLK